MYYIRLLRSKFDSLKRLRTTILFAGIAAGSFLMLMWLFPLSAFTEKEKVPVEDKNCQALPPVEQIECREEIVAQLLANSGFEAAMNYIAAVAPTGIPCHVLMHKFGMATYENTRDIGQALSHANTYCSGGFLHGIFEAYSMEEGPGISSEEVTRACQDLETEVYAIRWECYHALGHAVMLMHQNDIYKSVAVCDSLSEKMAKDRCLYGVFMENSYQHNYLYHGTEKNFIKADDPLYPCTIVDEKYKGICYVFPGRSYLFDISSARRMQLDTFSVRDFADAFNVCRRIEGPESYRRNCIRNIFIYVRNAFQKDWETAKTVCALLKPDYETFCLSQLGLLINRHDWRDEGLGERFCSGLTQEHIATCLDTVKEDSWYVPAPFTTDE